MSSISSETQTLQGNLTLPQQFSKTCVFLYRVNTRSVFLSFFLFFKCLLFLPEPRAVTLYSHEQSWRPLALCAGEGPRLSCPVLSFCAWPNCLGHSGCSRHLCWMKKWREGWWREWVLQGGIVDWGIWLYLWIRRAVVWWLPGKGAQLSGAQWGRQVTGGPGEMRK